MQDASIVSKNRWKNIHDFKDLWRGLRRVKVKPPQLLVAAQKLPLMPTMNMTKYMADPQVQAAMQKMGD